MELLNEGLGASKYMSDDTSVMHLGACMHHSCSVMPLHLCVGLFPCLRARQMPGGNAMLEWS